MLDCLWIASFPWACFQRTFNRGQPVFREHSTKVILLLETFRTTFNKCQSAFGDLSTQVSLLILGRRGCSWGACFIRKFLRRTQRIPPAHTIPYPSIHYPFVPYHNISRPNNTHPYFTLLAYPVGNTHPPMHWIVVHCTALQCDRLQAVLLSFLYHLSKKDDANISSQIGVKSKGLYSSSHLARLSFEFSAICGACNVAHALDIGMCLVHAACYPVLLCQALSVNWCVQCTHKKYNLSASPVVLRYTCVTPEVR